MDTTTNVDIRNVNTGEVYRTNVEQKDAWSDMPAGGYDAGWRIVPHGRTLVDSGAKGGEDISAQAVERINQQVDIIRKVDPTFLPTSTVRPFGTQIVDNDGRQHEVRRDLLANSPQAIGEKGLAAFGAQITRENREDFLIPVKDINIGDDGLWYLGDDKEGAMSATPEAWRGLMAQVGPERGWLAGLATVDSEGKYADVVKQCWDRYKQDAPDKNVRVGLRTLADADGNDQDQWYRTVSETYSSDALQADVMIGLLAEAVRELDGGDEYRMTGKYDPDTTSISVDIMRQNDTIPGMGSGDVYQTGFRFWTGDNGNRGGGASGLLMRNLCINIMITALEDYATATWVHRKGGEKAAQDTMRKVLALSHQVGGMFSPVIEKARTLKVSDLFPNKERNKVVDAIVAMKAMKRATTAVARDVAAEAVLLGWDREPGDTLWSLTNAVTRVHDGLIPAKHVPLFEEAALPLMRELVYG